MDRPVWGPRNLGFMGAFCSRGVKFLIASLTQSSAADPDGLAAAVFTSVVLRLLSDHKSTGHTKKSAPDFYFR